jgi:hypothetical protein
MSGDDAQGIHFGTTDGHGLTRMPEPEPEGMAEMGGMADADANLA